MKLSATPGRAQLIEWCKERAVANRFFNGQLSPAEINLIRREWPLYLETIAHMLDRDGDAPAP